MTSAKGFIDEFLDQTTTANPCQTTASCCRASVRTVVEMLLIVRDVAETIPQSRSSSFLILNDLNVLECLSLHWKLRDYDLLIS